jgi:hypothetical protein
MTSYFDLIPREIIEIILGNLIDISTYHNAYESKSVNDTPTDEKYWLRKIKSYCVIIDLKCIPHNLLDFSKESFEIILMNFFTIINAYNYTLDVINIHDRNVHDRKDFIKSGDITEDDPAQYATWAYDLCLTNFKLLKLNLIKSNKDILSLLDIISNKDILRYERHEDYTINIIFSDIDQYEFKIGRNVLNVLNVVYAVFRQDVINMIMHLRCNHSPEIIPF